MPHHRRYLRISKHTLLPCHITHTTPTDTTWLLGALPRILAAARPLVLPALQAARDNPRKHRPERYTVEGDDFHASLHLAALGTRHCVLRRRVRYAHGEGPAALRSNGGVLAEDASSPQSPQPHQPHQPSQPSQPSQAPGAKQRDDLGGEGKDGGEEVEEEVDADEKKKLAATTTYEGWDVGERVLHLFVERKTAGGEGDGAAARVVEEWIGQSQVRGEGDEEEE